MKRKRGIIERNSQEEEGIVFKCKECEKLYVRATKYTLTKRKKQHKKDVQFRRLKIMPEPNMWNRPMKLTGKMQKYWK